MVVAAASKAVAPTSPSLEKWDSVDIIGDLVDQENREIAKRQAELYTQRPVAQVTTKTLEELEQLSEDLWVAASQDRAAPAKILLDSGADPNALASITIILHVSDEDWLQLAARYKTQDKGHNHQHHDHNYDQHRHQDQRYLL